MGRRRKIWTMGLGVGLGTGVLLSLLSATPWGLRLLLHHGVPALSPPGWTIKIGRVEGSLATQIRLSDFEVDGGSGRTIAGHELRLRWSSGLWAGAAPTAELQLGQLRVAQGFFQATDTDATSVAAPASTTGLSYSEQLAFDFGFGLRISRLHLSLPGDSGAPLTIKDFTADLEHSAKRRRWDCALQVGGSQRAHLGLRLHGFTAGFRVEQTGLHVAQLALELADGRLQLEDLHIDDGGRLAQLGGLQLSYAKAALARLAPVSPSGDLTATLAGRGSTYAGQIRLPGYFNLDLERLQGNPVLGALPDGLDARGRVELAAQLVGTALAVDWQLTHNEVRPEGPITELRASVGNHRLEAQLTRGPKDARHLRGSVTSDNLAQLTAMAPANNGAVPGIEGRVDADFDCPLSASLHPQRCRFTLKLRDGKPIKRLTVVGSVQPSDPALVFKVEQFEADAQGSSLALLEPPATVVWDRSAGHVSTPGLGMLFARGGDRGELQLEGAFRGPLDSDVKLELNGFNLASLEHWLPGQLPGTISGILDAQLHARGAATAPRVALTADLTGFRFAQRGPQGSAPRLWRARQLRIEGDYTQQSGQMQVRASNVFAEGMAWARVHLGLALDDKGIDLSLTAAGRSRLRAAMTARLPIVVDLREQKVDLPADGALEAQLELNDVDLERLPPAVARFQPKGRLTATARLAGTLKQPQAELQLRGSGLAILGANIGRVQAAAKFDASTGAGLTTDIELQHPAHAHIQARGRVPVDWRWAGHRGTLAHAPTSEHHIQVQFAGISSKLLGAWAAASGSVETAPLDELRGLGEGQLEIRGSLQAPTIEAWLRWRELAYRGVALGDSLITARLGRGRLALDWIQSQGPKIRISGAASLPIAYDPEAGRWTHSPQAEHRADIDFYGLSVGDVRPWLKSTGAGANPWLDSLVGDLKLTLRGHALDYELAAKFAGQSGHAASPGAGPWPISAHLRVSPQAQHMTLDLGTENLAGAHAQVTTSAELGLDQIDLWPQRFRTSPLDGQIRVPRFALANFSGILPPEIYGLSGYAEAKLDLHGTVGVPRWRGWFSVTETRFTVVPWRQRMEGVELRGTLRDRSLEIERIRLTSGRGSIDGRASLDLGGSKQDVRVAKAELNITDLDVHRAGRAALNLNGRIRGRYVDRGTSRDLRLEFHEPFIRTLESKQAPPKPIPTSKAIRFTDGRTRTDAPEDAEPEVEDVPLDFELRLVDPLKLEGGRIQMTWQGVLAGRRVAGETQIHGDIAASDGHFELLGRRFDIEEGSISITKGKKVRPYVDITAVTRVRDTPITARIHGTRGQMQLRLSTREKASESEILHLLLTGQNDDRALAEASTAALLSSLSSTAVSRKIRRAARLDSLGLGFGDSLAEPVLYVGKQITRKLQAEARYHHGADQKEGENQAELRLRYQFNPEWRLEGHSGTARSGGLELLWQRQFDRALSKKPRTPAD